MIDLSPRQRKTLRILYFVLAVVFITAMTLYLADGKWMFAVNNLIASATCGWIGWLYGKEDKARERK